MTFICPACRWDPLAPSEEADQPDAGLSLTERYRGTQYSTSMVATPALGQLASAAPTSRVRTFVIVGFFVLLGMYGSMLVYSDFQNRPVDRPASMLDR